MRNLPKLFVALLLLFASAFSFAAQTGQASFDHLTTDPLRVLPRQRRVQGHAA